ncbi:MAG: hypothetical protein EOO01_27360 [Chitinophagaceae bacterium]|nr:MAG: hypothetical protein EOO01_27360 [Chitinophagaceae bacterium]
MKTVILSLLSFFFCTTHAPVFAADTFHQFIQFSPADPIDDFWIWFTKNEKRLKNFESDPDKYLTELLEQVKKIQRGLAIEFEPPKNGVINMTVSANGNVDLFNLVREMIERAPAIKGWKFIAFRQRMPIAAVKEMKLKVGELTLDPSLMKFFPVIENKQLNIIIYTTGVTEENYNQIAYASFVLLDNILGEYDCITKVSSFDFHPLPEKKEELADLKPLLELAAYVDEAYRKRIN